LLIRKLRATLKAILERITNAVMKEIEAGFRVICLAEKVQFSMITDIQNCCSVS